MQTSSITLILPLTDAQRSRKTGSKATNLSKLIAARFAVPRGFVISADAYRSHLWTSGARQIASSQVEAEERESIRSAILSQPIPDDVWQAITQAYERLSWQVGMTEPKVAVRSSSLEEGSNGAEFAGAYESFVNVSGLDALNIAIKRVWASLWNGKAAAYRAKSGCSGEPAMAVIIQQMVDAEYTGTALTASPITGDPHHVSVTLSDGRTDGQEPEFYTVDLRNMSITRQEGSAVTPNENLIHLITEQAIFVEDTITGRVEIEWAWDKDGLWILQARPIADLPAYFPTPWADDQTLRRRETSHPISHFARSLLQHPARSLANGHVYACMNEPDGAVSDARNLSKEISATESHLRLWRKTAEADLRSRIAPALNSDLTSPDQSALVQMLNDAARAVRDAADWIDRAEHPSIRFPKLLRELLGEGAEADILHQRLLGGLNDATFMRDARLQEFGERFAIAEQSGKLSDEKWWRSYKRDVERFAREYGYAFKDAGEMADIASWRSWIEDTDTVFRMIGAVARQDKRPTLVTLHCAAERDAEAAGTKVIETLKRGQRSRFTQLLALSRDWLCTQSEIMQVYALSCTALRLILIELGRRLETAGTIARANDIFQLTPDELSNLDSLDRTDIAALIARRKHEIWLETRLNAPETLPINETDSSSIADSIEGAFKGIPAGPGEATGRARIVDRIEDAGEIENGDILIVRTTKLAWTPFFTVAGGFISEQGSELSPEAIAARKFGVPAVMGCEGIISSIRDGQKITIDGSTGTVTFSSRTNP